MREKRFSAAENTVISALRLAPGNLPLLRMLGQIYLATEDWSRAEGVEATMRRIDGAAPKLAADELRLQIISRREGREQGVAFLEQYGVDAINVTGGMTAWQQAGLPSVTDAVTGGAS